MVNSWSILNPELTRGYSTGMYSMAYKGNHLVNVICFAKVMTYTISVVPFILRRL